MEEHPINAPKNAAGPLPDLLLLLPKRPMCRYVRRRPWYARVRRIPVVRSLGGERLLRRVTGRSAEGLETCALRTFRGIRGTGNRDG